MQNFTPLLRNLQDSGDIKGKKKENVWGVFWGSIANWPILRVKQPREITGGGFRRRRGTA
jgi:hypothetical protein